MIPEKVHQDVADPSKPFGHTIDPNLWYIILKGDNSVGLMSADFGPDKDHLENAPMCFGNAATAWGYMQKIKDDVAPMQPVPMMGTDVIDAHKAYMEYAALVNAVVLAEQAQADSETNH